MGKAPRFIQGFTSTRLADFTRGPRILEVLPPPESAMVGTVPSTHGSWGTFYQAIAMGENIQGIDYRMFKGPEVGREHTGETSEEAGVAVEEGFG